MFLKKDCCRLEIYDSIIIMYFVRSNNVMVGKGDSFVFSVKTLMNPVPRGTRVKWSKTRKSKKDLSGAAKEWLW